MVYAYDAANVAALPKLGVWFRHGYDSHSYNWGNRHILPDEYLDQEAIWATLSEAQITQRLYQKKFPDQEGYAQFHLLRAIEWLQSGQSAEETAPLYEVFPFGFPYEGPIMSWDTYTRALVERPHLVAGLWEERDRLAESEDVVFIEHFATPDSTNWVTDQGFTSDAERDFEIAKSFDQAKQRKIIWSGDTMQLYDEFSVTYQLALEHLQHGGGVLIENFPHPTNDTHWFALADAYPTQVGFVSQTHAFNNRFESGRQRTYYVNQGYPVYGTQEWTDVYGGYNLMLQIRQNDIDGNGSGATPSVGAPISEKIAFLEDVRDYVLEREQDFVHLSISHHLQHIAWEVGWEPQDFFNEAPVAAGESYDVVEDMALNVSAVEGVLANDADPAGDDLTASLQSAPLFGDVILNSDGSFEYTPNADFNGIDSFSYRAVDGTNNSEAVTVTLNVAAVNDPPVVLAPAVALEATEQVDLSIHGLGFSVSDVDEDGSGATMTLTVGEGILTIDVGDSGATIGSGNGASTVVVNGTIAQLDNLLTGAGSGTIAYRNENDAPSAAITLTATVSDLGNVGTDPGISGDEFSEVDSESVTINVAAVNDPPVVADDAYTINEDVPLIVDAAAGVLANDDDPDGTSLSLSVSADPLHGALEMDPDGSFVYTPKAHFNGVDFFVYRVDDGESTSEAVVVRIDVAAVNDAPIVSAPTGPLAAIEQVDLPIHGVGFRVGDVDVADAQGPIIGEPVDFEVVATLAVGEGVLTVDVGDSGAAIESGNGANSVTISGTIDQIDNLLSGVGSGTILYRNDNESPVPTTTLTVMVDDLGANGADPGVTGGPTNEVGSNSVDIDVADVA
ncbi:MAG: Ig-like domain-containing protein, partial [Planctomycetota bacterium]